MVGHFTVLCLARTPLKLITATAQVARFGAHFLNVGEVLVHGITVIPPLVALGIGVLAGSWERGLEIRNSSKIGIQSTPPAHQALGGRVFELKGDSAR